MLRLLLGIILLTFVSRAGAQASSSVNLRATLSSCSDVPVLFEFDGSSFHALQRAEKKGEEVYEFHLPASEPRFYYVGSSNQNMKPLILGQEGTVEITGQCANLRSADIVSSDINVAYESLKEEMEQLRRKSSILARKYQMAQGEGSENIVAEMKALDEQKLALLNATQEKDPFLGKIVAINTYLSYQNNPRGYDNELDYFANEFFRFVDFRDEAYNTLPWVFEAFKSYATTLSSVGLSEEVQREYFDGILLNFERGSGGHKLALSGLIGVLKEKRNGNFTYFAEQFIQAFEESDPGAAASMKAEVERARAFVIGGEAPDFTQKTPSGEGFSLSELRGKVVLVDFWASWCGPCRRENPNVVRLYQKYKDKGFEILGVSLDKTHGRWVQAIESDGLEWQHVSDLKGWANEVAQAYGVRSIPHTILLDPEGRILARNLRGEALENKLAELFD